MDDSQLVLLVYFLELMKVELSRINRVFKQEEVFNLRIFYKNLTKRKSMESFLIGTNFLTVSDPLRKIHKLESRRISRLVNRLNSFQYGSLFFSFPPLLHMLAQPLCSIKFRHPNVGQECFFSSMASNFHQVDCWEACQVVVGGK